MGFVDTRYIIILMEENEPGSEKQTGTRVPVTSLPAGSEYPAGIEVGPYPLNG